MHAIDIVVGGGRYLAPPLRSLREQIARGGLPAGVLTTLSAREREIFDLLVNGSTNR
jgi:DNA-binding NarL/FixJ family response regulator